MNKIKKEHRKQNIADTVYIKPKKRCHMKTGYSKANQ